MTTPSVNSQSHFVAAISLMMGQMVFTMTNGTQQPVTKATVSVAGKTYTHEELEYTAAVRAAKACNMPSDLLAELADQYPPPAEWLDSEEEMPF